MKYFIITEDTTPDELKRQYRRLCKRYHPDKAGGYHDAQAQINAEYQQALEQLAEIASRTGNSENSQMIARLMQQHLYNMYEDLKMPLIKRYVPQEYQGLAFELAKMIEGRWK